MLPENRLRRFGMAVLNEQTLAPAIDFRLVRANPSAGAGHALNRHAAFLLPLLGCTDTDTEIISDFLPGIQPAAVDEL